MKLTAATLLIQSYMLGEMFFVQRMNPASMPINWFIVTLISVGLLAVQLNGERK